MMYLQRTKPKSKRRLLQVVFLILLFVFVLIIHRINPSTAPRLVSYIATPLLSFENMLAGQFEGFATLLLSKENLEKENKFLKDRVIELESLALFARSLEEENLELRSFLGREDNNEKVLAYVLASPPLTPYDVIIIDVGEEEGVSLGDVVVSSEYVGVGDVVEVFPHSSKVSLYSSPGREIPVLIGASETEAVAYGIGGGGFEALLPREIDVNVGDGVFLTGDEHLLYGKISSVQTRDTDFLQLVSFVSPVNIYEFRRALVIISNNEEETDQEISI